MVSVCHAWRWRWRFARTAVPVLAASTLTLLPLPISPLHAGQPGAATFDGRVLDAQSGRPIAEAVVVLVGDATGTQRVAVTDAAGRFALIPLEMEPFTLRASAVGYVGRRFGQRHALDSGARLTHTSATLQDLELTLRRGGGISGRVLDPDGLPMEFAEIEALRPRLQRDQRILVPIGSAQSGADGRFTINGLPEGSYYVGAFDPADEATLDATGQSVWHHIFYPGVAAAIDATRVGVEPGATVSGLEFTLRTIPRVSVGGRLLTPEGADLISGAVTLSPESGSGISLGPNLAATVTPDGAFEFTRVQPGTYRIRAQATGRNSTNPLFATFLIAVQEVDLSSVVLSLNRGTRLEGRLEFEPRNGTRPPPSLDVVWLGAPMGDGALSWGMTTAPARLDGSFAFDSPEGTRVIRPTELPPPWSLERVTLRGRDITDRPMDFSQGDTLDDVRVVLTDQLTRLTGLVTTAAGEPVSDRAVVALSANPFLRHAGSRHTRLVYPDLNGRYDIVGLPPGTYLVSVVGELYEGELVEREMFDVIARVGRNAVIEAGATTTLDLTLGDEGERLAQ